MVVHHERSLGSVTGCGHDGVVVAPGDQPRIGQHALQRDAGKEAHFTTTGTPDFPADLFGGASLEPERLPVSRLTPSGHDWQGLRPVEPG